MTAARLIELLAQHITEHGKQGDVTVNVPGATPIRDHHPVVRCWWDAEKHHVVIEAT